MTRLERGFHTPEPKGTKQYQKTAGILETYMGQIRKANNSPEIEIILTGIKTDLEGLRDDKDDSKFDAILERAEQFLPASTLVEEEVTDNVIPLRPPQLESEPLEETPVFAQEDFSMDGHTGEGGGMPFQGLQPKEVRSKLKDFATQLIALKEKGKEAISNAGEWSKEKITSAGTYLSDTYHAGTQKIKNLIGTIKSLRDDLKMGDEESAEPVEDDGDEKKPFFEGRVVKPEVLSRQEQVDAYMDYLEDKSKEYTGKIKELTGKGWDHVKKGLTWYSKQSWQKKVIVTGALFGASGAIVLTGGSASWLWVISTAMMGQRIVGGAALAMTIEAALEQKMRRKEIETGQERSTSAMVVKFLAAGGTGVLIGGGVVGAGIKEAADATGASEAIQHWIASLTHGSAEVPHTAPTSAPIDKGYDNLTVNHDAVAEGPNAATGLHESMRGLDEKPPANVLENYDPKNIEIKVPDGIPFETGVDVPNAAELHVEVRKGEGAYEFWKEFRDKLMTSGFKIDGANTPSAIKHILESNPHDLAQEFGFATDNTSGLMEVDDKLSISDKGAIVFSNAHGETYILGESLSSSEYKAGLPFQGIDQANPVSASVATDQVPAAESTTAPAAQEGDFTMLKDEVAGAQVTPEVHYSAPATPEAPGSSDFTTLGESSAQAAEAPAAPLGPDAYVNSYGTTIDPHASHVYNSSKGAYVFGGNAQELQAKAEEYVLANKKSVFIDKSHRNILGIFVPKIEEWILTEKGVPAVTIHTDRSLVLNPQNFNKLLS